MTKTEAFKKIRNHLEKRSNHTVKPTERIIRYWWQVCNVALFDNKLYPPTISFTPKLKEWGYCTIDGEEIEIGICPTIGTRGLLLATLIHEMVHQWEQQNYGWMGHGKKYRKWTVRIKKTLGLDIHILIDIDDDDGKKQLYKRRHKNSLR